MIVLSKGTSHKIRLTTDASGDIEAHYTIVDKTGTGPASYSYAGAGEPLASITSATTTDIVVGAASTERSIRHLTFYNNHASQAVTCTVFEEDGTDTVTHQKLVLAAGEALKLDAAGVWTHYDANGGPYVGLGPMATQADMETGTSTTTVVTPGRMHFHPGMAKCVGMTTGTTTPASQTPPAYNLTSITDTGVGRLTVTIANDFSSANYSAVLGGVGISTTLTAIALVNTFYIRTGTLAAGTFEINARDATATTNALADPSGYAWACYGDL